VESGADVNVKNNDGSSPLHFAAEIGSLSVVKLLVESGADVRVKNHSGQTASELARVKGKEDVSEWLDSVSRR